MSVKKICFIANYYKTDVFVAIAKELAKHNISTYWIVPNYEQNVKLKTSFNKNHVLYIGKNEVLKSTIEYSKVDLKINELIYGDRALSLESKKWTYLYLSKLKGIYYDFIKQNGINYIFGELTWAHELIAHRLTLRAKELNCEFLNPHTIRIPNGRFAFFTDEFQSKIKETSRPKEEKVNSKIIVEKPAYLALNDALLSKKTSLKFNLTKLKYFILRTNQDSNDPTLYSNPKVQFIVRIKEMYNRWIFHNFITEKDVTSLPKDKKFVLFTLHKQPEASIDVIGRYYENQLNLIINIWRILPENFALLVKEHSNAIGDRSLQFYKKVKGLTNTYLVNNKTDSHEILENCEAVFTVSGTIAYEASLKGKRAFTFAPTFFNRLHGCTEVSWKNFNNSNLTELISAPRIGLEIDEFSNWLLGNSFEGIMSDSFGDPRCMEEENIEKMSNAFMKMIK